jgi:LCP family protein required for cell wall assembly
MRTDKATSKPQGRKQTAGSDTWGRRLLRGLCSSLVPGVGQLVGGARRRGYILLGVVVAVLVGVVLVFLLPAEDLDQLSAWILEPSVLLGLLVADVVLLVFRLYAVTDAVWLRRGKGGAAEVKGAAAKGAAKSGAKGTSRPKASAAGAPARATWKTPAVAAALVLLLAFTVFPHAWVGYRYVYRFWDTLTTVFVHETPTEVSTVSTAPPVTISAGDDQRLTILFLGSDAGVGRTGSRSDSNIVASFDLNTGRIALLSVPRNTGDAPLSEAAQAALGTDVWHNWINELYGAARQHAELAPEGGDAGAVTMRDTLSLILGIPIDYYAVVDMLGFVDLVDIMGGVDIYFESPLHASISPPTEEEETLVYNFSRGMNHLDGRMALAYSRTRRDSSDYVRMGRQRCVIAALIDQTEVWELAWNFPAVMGVVETMVRTDIPLDALQQLVRLRSRFQTDEMITMAFQKYRYTNGTNHNPVELGWILDYALIQSTVQQILEHPEEVLGQATQTGLDTGNCWQAPEDQ